MTALGHAIQTRYAGYHFRSRLEARWAVFFDTLGVPWLYEPEAYVLPSGSYLPDFGLPEVGERGAWFEVKPERGTQDDPRWSELAVLTDVPVFVVHGMADVRDLVADPHTDRGWIDKWFPDDGASDTLYYWCHCPTCGKPGIEWSGAYSRIPCPHGGTSDDNPVATGQRRVLTAYAMAHSYRFDPKGRR